MGIYDRDYYRKEGPSIFEAIMPSGRVCKWLIFINCALFLVQMFAPGSNGGIDNFAPSFTSYLIFDSVKIHDWQVWRLITYAFLHASFLHLLFNMMFLWMFGSELERIYGSREFLAFYLVAVFLGGLAYFGYSLSSPGHQYMLGASGGVTALLVLYACYYPHQKVMVFFALPMPVWAFAAFNVLMDGFALAVPGVKPRVAVVVHLAGAAFAFAYFHTHIRLLGWLPNLRSLRSDRVRPRLSLFRPELDENEPVSVSAPSSAHPEIDEHLEAKLDAVLEKVARHGQHSLTENERQVLLKASEIYKRKRS